MKAKRKVHCLVMAVLMGWMLSCPVLASSFPDVDKQAMYAEAVEYVSENGYIVGDAQGNFNPSNTVTRAQMAVIICRVLGETEGLSPASKFSDVPASYWANASIAKASDLGIISGYSDGTFHPNNAVTYEQAITMVIRAVGGEDVAKANGGYPEGYLLAAQENGFLENISTKKGNPFPRCDVAVILYNYYVMSSEVDG